MAYWQWIPVFALAIGALVYAWQALRLRLTYNGGPPHQNVGTDAVYTVTVRNPGRMTRNAGLSIHGVPPGWAAAFSYPQVRLEPRESATVPIVVRVPADARANTGTLIGIRARPNKYSPWWIRTNFTLNTVDVVPGAPVEREAPPAERVTPATPGPA